jgi:hypothetical protein
MGTTYVAVFALVLAYVALVAAYLSLRTLAKLRRASSVLARGARGPSAQESLIEASSRNAERLDVVAEEIAELRAYLATGATGATGASSSGGSAGGLSNVALVRYDAFGEMSGRMSFSLALLDDKGDGVAISSIAGTTETRVYAKGVTDGKGEHDLSPEEQQAIAAALRRRTGLLARRSA